VITAPRPRLAAIGVAAVLATGVTVGVVALSAGSPTDDAAQASARSFLATYVKPDGRVVRTDQGGDTVSEGQSYALLLAQVAGDDKTFARVWQWTQSHLMRPDGLLAYRADAHRVQDSMAASDADLVTAWALARAQGPGAGRYHAAGRRMANAVLAHETARGNATTLTAGPWATGSPATVNPSYFAFPAMDRLGGRWHAVRARSLALVRDVTSGGRLLPPDWVRIDGNSARPTPAPDGKVPDVRYSLDAQRTVIWLAASCEPQARRVAAGWWPTLSRTGRDTAIALDQHGRVLVRTPHVLPLVAAAAAASAAGRSPERDSLLARADAQNAAHPTYYGAAWAALGRGLLTTGSLGGCAPNGGTS
jgi:endoglucanase